MALRHIKLEFLLFYAKLYSVNLIIFLAVMTFMDLKIKKNYAFILLIFVWFANTGLSANPLQDIPKPKISFSATVIDDQDVSTNIKNITWDGRLYFIGKRGRATVTIPFEKVKKVEFLNSAQSGYMNAKVSLREGNGVGLSFDENTTLYGATPFGTYRITVKNIKEIVFK